MARIRSIKPEFWSDRKLARLACRDARLLYMALWNLSDEWGRLNGDWQWIKGQVFPYDDDLDAACIGKLLAELENPELGAVVAYEADGDPYLFLPKLGRHQRLEPEKVGSRLPAPPYPDDTEPPPVASAGSRDEPAPNPDPFAPDSDGMESGADSSGSHADSSGPGANKPALLYVAGGRGQVAGGRGVARAHAVPNAPAPAFTEVPEDFTPTDAMRRWAHKTHPGLDLDFETTQFIRHYRGEGKRKKSWVEPWQKWIADSHRRFASSRSSPSPVDRREQAHQARTSRAFQRAAAREANS